MKCPMCKRNNPEKIPYCQVCGHVFEDGSSFEEGLPESYEDHVEIPVESKKEYIFLFVMDRLIRFKEVIFSYFG